LGTDIGGGARSFLLWKDPERSGAWVIGFLNLGIGEIRTGIFNVADIAVMVGVALLAWTSWRRDGMQKSTN
jgi:signal peptidase II